MSPVHALVVLLAAFGGEPAGEVLEFSATYCGPCREMASLVARLEREGLPIRKIDTQADRELTEQHNITAIPTFLLLVNGREVTRVVGKMTEADLRRMCSRIPLPAAPAVQLVSNPQQRNAGVTQPIATAVPAVEKKPNRLKEFLGLGDDHEPDNVRGNDTELGGASEVPATVTTTDPMLASVRLRASINGQISLGSGTIVFSQPGRTLIVTCGHIFRNRDENTKVEVDLFENGQPQTYVGSIIDVDLAADVGLVSIPTHSVVSSTPLAPPTLVLEKAQRVACIGCSGGNEPTREQLSITEVNKYDGPDNIECTGTPVQGRSGGGLFCDNQLIGVCIAAVTDEALGVYAHVFAVHDLLDRNQLSHLYQPATLPEGAVLADAASSTAAPADFPAELGAESAAADTAAALSATTEVTGATAEPATTEATDLAGVMADVSAGDAEVVVIIRARSNPNAESRVVIINRASPKFLAYLNGEIRPEGLAANRPARLTPPTTATRNSPTVQSQTQPVSFQPPRSPAAPRRQDRSLTRRAAAGRQFPATASK